MCVRIDAVSALEHGRVDPCRVRDSVISFDTFHSARGEFNRKNGLRETPESMSITLGPQPAKNMLGMMTMLPAQIAALRLVATLAPQLYGCSNVQWCVDSLITVHPEIVRDWFDAMARYAKP